MSGGNDLINVIVSFALGAAPATGMAAPAAPAPDPVVICEPGGSSQWEVDAENLAAELAGVTGDEDVDALREELEAAGFEPQEDPAPPDATTDTRPESPDASGSDDRTTDPADEPAEDATADTDTSDSRDETSTDPGTADQDWRELAATLEEELAESATPEAEELAGELESLDLAAAAGLPAQEPDDPAEDDASTDEQMSDGEISDGETSDDTMSGDPGGFGESGDDAPAGVDESSDPEPADTEPVDPDTEDCEPAEGSDRRDMPENGDPTGPRERIPAEDTTDESGQDDGSRTGDAAPSERRSPTEEPDTGGRTPADEVGLPSAPSEPETAVCIVEDAPAPQDTRTDATPAVTQDWEQMAGQLAATLAGNADPRARQLSEDLAAAGFGPREEEWVQIARELAAAVEDSTDPRARQLSEDLAVAGFTDRGIPECGTGLGDVQPGDRILADDPADPATPVGTRTR